MYIDQKELTPKQLVTEAVRFNLNMARGRKNGKYKTGPSLLTNDIQVKPRSKATYYRSK